LATTRTVAGPRPKRAGQVAPQAEQVETDASPFSGSDVSWCPDSKRTVNAIWNGRAA
jgi:hypothetical protein